MSDTSLAVAGGGVVGMALALAAADDAPTLLLDSPRHAGGRFYALNAASVDFLTTAGRRSLPPCTGVRRFLLVAGDKRLHLDAAGEAPLCRIIGEDALLGWLRTAPQNIAMTRHEWSPMTIDKCYCEADNIVLELGGKRFAAGMLVAADGARSPVARALNIGAAVSSFAQRALTARVHVEGLADDTAAQWFAPRDVLALLPLGGGIFSLVWSLPEIRARALVAQGIVPTAAAVRARTGLPVTAADKEDVHSFMLMAVRRAARTATKTAFVGDAAQVIHPLAGQGLNTGLADAACLLDCRRRHTTAAAVLADYAVLSRRRGAALHGLTCAINHGGRWLESAFALGALPPLLPLRRLVVGAANC